MTYVVLLILAVLWAVVLVPPLVRARTERSADSIGDFHYRLGVLGRTHGHGSRSRGARRAPVPLSPPIVPAAAQPRVSSRPSSASPASAPPVSEPAAARMAKRRRDVISLLIASMAVTFLGAYVVDTAALWALQVFTDLLLIAYGAMLWYFGRLQLEQADKLRYLPPTPVVSPPATSGIQLRRTASS